MNIKNYTSTVYAHISINKIEKCLVEIGASNINKEYENKICLGITYLLFDDNTKQTLCFNIKAKVQECFKILWAEVSKPQSGTKERILLQADRTAWKILSDWIEIQCTMVLLGQASPLQMFLPFAYNPQTKESLFDRIVSGKAQLLLN